MWNQEHDFGQKIFQISSNKYFFFELISIYATSLTKGHELQTLFCPYSIVSCFETEKSERQI